MSHAEYGPVYQMPTESPPKAPQSVRSASTTLGILGLVLGLLGLGIGTAAWFRAGAKSAAPTYSEQQVADAKTAVCDAYTRGTQSLRVVASRVVDNPADMLPVAVNSRLAEVTVGNYIINALVENPAAPTELRHLLSEAAYGYQDIALIQIAEGPSVDYESETERVNQAVSRLDQICQ